MNKIQLLTILSNVAKEYHTDAIASVKRNSHMNDVTEDDVLEQDVVDAIIVDFINYVGVWQGIDYAMYTKDLKDTKRDL